MSEKNTKRDYHEIQEYLYSTGFERYSVMHPAEFVNKMKKFEISCREKHEKLLKEKESQYITSFAMVPNVPVMLVSNVMHIIVNERKWNVEQIIFMGALQSKIQVPNQAQITPVCCIICSLQHKKNEHVEFEAIELGKKE